MRASCTRNIFYIIVAVIIALIVWSLFAQTGTKPDQVNISQVTDAVKNNEVSKIVVSNDKLTVDLKSGKTWQTYKESGVGINQYGITPDKVAIDIQNSSSNSIWPTIIGYLLPFLLIGGFIFFMLRQAQGGNMKAMNFGQSRARLFQPGAKKTTFADVAGLEEPKQELYEIVEFLKSPGKFQNLGAEIPKGVLLVGPPGTGKTLLARAVAGEAGVPFFSISASEFVEMFVGVGAARVRDLFQKAKRNAPAILFIDELDAIGRQRGGGMGSGSHDEREQTLNQILVEMDGFETDTRVIVMAATNRPDVLDPALLRPGRFDRRVVIDIPDLKEREEILKIHGRNKPLAKDVDLERIARSTAGLSGADLRNVMNEAAILTARANAKSINQNQLNMAIEKVILGPERKSHLMSVKEKEISAYHEAGHAIIGKLLPNTDEIHKISIVSRGSALGYTWSLPTEDRKLYSKAKFEDEIAQLLGGFVSEKIIFNEVTTGAQNDLKRATKIAKDMVTVYGMSDLLGPVVLKDKEDVGYLRELGEQKNYSESKATQIDAEVSRIISDAQKKATRVLSGKKSLLKKIALKLIKEETIEGVDFDKLF
ncbi:TPA: ATP-dependent zinc metalloprotease FtsH [Candidatus Berkelbacteria bacterium]|uniref:ATP-dependent zinc metalloprotease FtsH n=1 Tax=Berkelbacteria bacterium GW2011_GWE1_39_12 TaxID=1618337 RepID=A0A0G4B468_9BACT|nr:MAG: ATP-dependent metalloprotease FtsH, cell division protease FtsH [Berkelbacteria bacterium GW2011_GWE1_39_12]HBO60981.1 ATP-dependent zinc metalloprotease FtsH [Candidatus Berkelbacteria bacterium]